MNDDPNHLDPEAIPEEEQEHDSRIGAKMHLFLERMVRAACEEEGIDEERAVDVMLCAAVQFYSERSSTNPRDIGVLCRAIAEEALSGAEDADTLH